jgi:UDP-N-acetylglucosamine--N-acetylmuramyl-(pentapeptide) pyrophosphoryl-undecaprenol N-acetylglucosamine transferase
MTPTQTNTFTNTSSSERKEGKKLKFLIAGGGTGGHIFPAVAIANALKKLAPQAQFLFVGAKGKMEMEKVPQAGYKIEGLDIAGYNRSSLIKNIALPFKLLKSFWQVRKIVTAFEPDAVIGVGGYSTYPVLKYAQNKQIPTFIHESNSFAGKSNKLLGKKATIIFTASDGMERFFPISKIRSFGNPVRNEIVNKTINRVAAIQQFGLNEKKQTVLAIGGSLGARSINEALAVQLEDFGKNDLQLIWQTGKATATEYMKIAEGKDNIWAGDFITNMSVAYAAADIIISRAGSGALAELCVVAKPSVLVPFPFAAEDHQTANAMHLVNKNAALIVKDNEAKEKLVSTVLNLAKDASLQQQLVSNISTMAITNADEIIAAEILKSIGAWN